MVSERMRIALAAMPVRDVLGLAGLCAASAHIGEVSGAGIMLMTDDVQRGSLSTTDEVSATVEDLQYELREGPCVDAYRQQQTVLEPDLAGPVTPRWASFTPAALDAGVRAIFGFPLGVGQVHLGALNLYRDRAGPLSAVQQQDCEEMADLIGVALLDLQSHAEAGEVAVELDAGANLQPHVHQASGMVAAQAGVSVSAAVTLLRVRALADGERLAETADRVIGREIRFDQPDLAR